MEELPVIAKVAGHQAIKSFETLTGAPEDEPGKIFSQLTAARVCLLRVLINKEQPDACMPKPARPQFPEIEIDEVLTKHQRPRHAG